uniref:Indole-3-acetic acid-induced protein ARG7 n=1 Tax=Anthurium amnicola TaxID=1678845 RepID=A0A1D1XGG2_9ARAE
MERVRKGLILKTLERCRSMSQGRRKLTLRLAPVGCLCVRVGPGKERFLIKMECVNHPLFRVLLEEAETEYGYAHEGPLELPCEVDLFQRLLWEIEQEEGSPLGRNCVGGYGGYQLLTPRRTPMVCRVQSR